MKVTEFALNGLKLIELPVYGDARGFFTERFHRERFREIGLPVDDFVQDNFSRSSVRVLRGLHFQFDQPQGKLVTATSGRIFDVAVDIRKDSPTFGQWVGVELDSEKPAWFWVPAGFAHGFVVLSEQGADVLYKVNAYYNPKGEGGILWNDKDLGIEWPVFEPLLSPRDQQLMSWADYQKSPRF